MIKNLKIMASSHRQSSVDKEELEDFTSASG